MATPRFIFRLEPLLDLRKRAEKDKQIKLAEVQQRIAALTRQIQEAEASINRQNQYLSAEKLVGPLDLTFIAHEKRYVGSLQLQIAQCLQKIAGEDQNLHAARRELLVAARDRKIIEKLREKQFARWLADQARIEAAFTDEIGTQLALRNMSDSEQL